MEMCDSGCLLLGSRFPNGPILRVIEELQDPGVKSEVALHVAGARVVIANYRLIQHDFPWLRTDVVAKKVHGRTHMSARERLLEVRRLIDDWLIEYAACVACRQAEQCLVNTPIRTDGTRIAAYRPSAYGRSLVIPVSIHHARMGNIASQRAGLLDIKGAGVPPEKTPSHQEHSDGLDYLGIALSDFAMQRIMDEIFEQAYPSFWTVPTYAILDLGFDVLNGWRGTSPAGMHVRRAHRRPLYGMDLPATGSVTETVKIQIEMLLRNYGITSTNPGTSFDIAFTEDTVQLHYAGQAVAGLNASEIHILRGLRRFGEEHIRIEGINMQLARDVGREPSSGHVVDFGHIEVQQTFKYALASLVRDRTLRLGGIIWPDDPAFIQPDPELQLNLDEWDRRKLNDRCFALAEHFRAGAMSSADVVTQLDNLVRMAFSKWPS